VNHESGFTIARHGLEVPMTIRTEAQLRLDTLLRQMDAPAISETLTTGLVVAVGLVVVVALQVVLFAGFFGS